MVPPQIILMYVPHLLLDYIFAITQGILRSKNRIKEYARLTNINSFFTAVGICGGVFWRITGLIIGKYIASLVAIAYAGMKLKDTAVFIRRAEKLSKSEKKALWHYSIIIVPVHWCHPPSASRTRRRILLFSCVDIC